MDGIELEDELIGKTFLRLIGQPLTEQQLMSLGRLERALYVVCKFKLGEWTDIGHRSFLNKDGHIRYSGPITDILASVLDHQLGLAARQQVLYELYQDKWLGDRKFEKSSNVTLLLVAMVVYGEGGGVKYDNNLYHGPSA